MGSEMKSMEQAIRDMANDLMGRNISEEKAMELYRAIDRQYRDSVNHKTHRGAAELYVRREGCALYLKERYEVDMK